MPTAYKSMRKAPQGGRWIVVKITSSGRTVKVRWNGRHWDEGNGEKWDSWQLAGWKDIEMAEPTKIIPKGTQFVLTHKCPHNDEESPEGVIGVFQAVVDINVRDAELRYIKERRVGSTRYINMADFAAWLSEVDYVNQLIQFPEWQIDECSIPGAGSQLNFHGKVPR